MFNPVISMLQTQQAFAAQTLNLAAVMAGCMVKAMHMNYGVVTHCWAPHRAEDLHLHPEPEKHTAVLTHHYGRRAHDVDVEHLR